MELAPEVKLSAQANAGNVNFEITFFRGSSLRIGVMLKKLLIGLGFSITEVKPDDQTLIWVAEMPLGEVVTDSTIENVRHSVALSLQHAA